MRLTCTCIVVSNVARARDFYTTVLERPPRVEFPTYVEFDLEGNALAFFDAASQEELAPRSATPGENRSSMVEIEVRDVDRERERLEKLPIEWVTGPTDQPWGTRSIYFRDPEGNLVSFFARLPR